MTKPPEQAMTDSELLKLCDKTLNSGGRATRERIEMDTLARALKARLQGSGRAAPMTVEEASEKALALLNLLESDFGQSGRDVRLLAIRDELLAASPTSSSGREGETE